MSDERADAIRGAIAFMGHRARCAIWRTNGTCDCGRDRAAVALAAAAPHMAGTRAEPDVSPEARTSWLCETCGWAHTFDEPMATVYCVACFHAGRGKDVRCRRTFPHMAGSEEAERLREAARAFVRETGGTHPAIARIPADAPAAIRYDQTRAALLALLDAQPDAERAPQPEPRQDELEENR